MESPQYEERLSLLEEQSRIIAIKLGELQMVLQQVNDELKRIKEIEERIAKITPHSQTRAPTYLRD